MENPCYFCNKVETRYCNTCKKWMCDGCKADYPKRIKAFLKEKFA